MAALLSLAVGEITIRLSDIPAVFRAKEGMEYVILTKLRIPRIVLAIAIGGSLSLAGTLLQGIYRNPLVEPYTMGISGGGAFGVAICIVLGLHLRWGSYLLPVFGFLGALATIFMVRITSYNVCYTKLLRIPIHPVTPRCHRSLNR